MNENVFIRHVGKINQHLLDLVIQYPYFEDYSYTSKITTKELRIVDGIRYDAYVTQVFNLIEEMYEECVGKYLPGMLFDNINRILFIAEYLYMHRNWWDINFFAYPSDFIKKVNEWYKILDSRDTHYYWQDIKDD